MVAGGFAERLSEWLLDHYSHHGAGKLADVIVFVPTSRVAARVRAMLSLKMTGVLPAVLPLKGNGELADLLGIEMPSVVRPEAAMVEIAEVLKAIALEDERGLETTKGERLWRRVESLYRVLDRLALYGISVSDLRRTVPDNMVGLWEAQASTLVLVMGHMERWLACRGEVLAGAAERLVLEQAARVLDDGACAWIPVVAGELDGTQAAQAVAKVASLRGAVLVPELGPVTAELAEAFLAQMPEGGDVLAMGGMGRISECVAESDWDEVWVVALGVRRAVDSGKKRVAVVSASSSLLRRVSGLLARWGMVVPVAGEMCMDHTPAGREVLARTNWGMNGGRASEWLEAMVGSEVEGEILKALEPLREVDGWLEMDDWQALMQAVLGQKAAPVGAVTEGIFLLGPLDARLLDFDTVIAAGCVEGIWPNSGQDAWLSEAHLRALALPEADTRAKLAGTEFESVVAGGSGEVMVTRAKVVNGKETVASRFIAGVKGLRGEGFKRETELVAVLDEVKSGGGAA